MKESILKALKAKFPGVNANILDRIAAQLAKTVTAEDQVATAVEGVTKDFIDVIEAYGDSRATDAQKSAVQNYEAKHGLKDGKKVVKPAEATEKPADGTSGGGDATPAWAQALIDSNRQLTERLNRMETERAAAGRKTQLSAVLAKLPENLRKGYERISVDGLDEEKFSALLEEVRGEVEGIVGGIGAKGAVFGRPAAHGGTGGDGKLTAEQEAAIAKREGGAKDGQPF